MPKPKRKAECRYCLKEIKDGQRGKIYCSMLCYRLHRPRQYDDITYKMAVKMWNDEMPMIPVHVLPRDLAHCIIRLWEVKKALGLSRLVIKMEDAGLTRIR